MTLRLLFNPTDSPLVIDGPGRSLGGREWGPGDDTDPVTKALIGAGRVYVVDEPLTTAGLDAAVAAGINELQRRRDAAASDDPAAPQPGSRKRTTTRRGTGQKQED